MFKIRGNEPSYAKLNDPVTQETNRYGTPINLLERAAQHKAVSAVAKGESMRINGDEAVGSNPNRYKQHGFHFTADNCIGCHACEAACSEKNDLPPHLSFRAVGYVESGTYPAFTRLNISMACNHCDDPVCLKGCPTRAYTKFAEYGAVLQDPDICFGCGYCTWVCPYNAPQLDPIAGHVQKCNMCVDRLEAGLKPACVAACLGNALDFGVIENTPARRTQTKTEIPGFPTPEITHPNIRFEQKKSLERSFTRPDSAPIRYHREAQSGRYRPEYDEAKAVPRQWNLKALLSTHENAHIVFTLTSQAVMGAFVMLVAGLLLGGPFAGLAQPASKAFLPLVAAGVLLMSFGLARLNLHLGKPHRFYRGFYNWRLSPVSREIAGVSLFFLGLSGAGFFALAGHYLGWPVLFVPAAAAVAAGLLGAGVGLYYMYKLYRIPARPYWDHWQTGASFAGTALTLGAALIAAITALTLGLEAAASALRLAAGLAMAGLALESIGLAAHARDLRAQGGEGAVSHREQTSRYGNAYLLRNGLLGANLILLAPVALWGLSGPFGAAYGILLLLSLLVSAIIGRALFYVLVIPTTMPGAFFWRNKGFEAHARDTGLAGRPQTGVVPHHHKTSLDRLRDFLKEELFARKEG